MKVLITGGAGFIGSHTSDLLLKEGFKVRVFDNLEPQVHGGKKPEYLNPKVEFFYGDIKNKDQWKKILEGVDAVIHLAGMVGIGQSMYQPVRYLHANTIGTAFMYEAILENENLKKSIKKIIVASSKSIYGEGAYKCKKHGIVHPQPRLSNQLEKHDWEVHCPLCNDYVVPIGITEEKPVQNLSVYALSKYDTERLAIDFGNALNITSVAFRYFNVYGPRQSLNNPYTGVAAIFLSRVKNNNPPIIFEDGKQTRDFIFVEDIARANLLALEKAEKTDVYNVGTGVPITIGGVADIITDLVGSKVEPEITEKFRAGDNRHDFADITKISKEMGFKPKWSLKQGFSELIKWSETQRSVDKFDQAEKERLKYFG
jgi:dTDP-L-rhamnose 4-epimerase